jgi:hypothetical protein
MISGLPESHISEELCWSISSTSGKMPTHTCPDTSHRPIKWKAPSWSWASTRYPVILPRLSTECRPTRHHLIRFVSCEVSTKPSGELIQASLWIECKPIPFEIRHYGFKARILLFGIEQTFESMFVSMDEWCAKEDGGRLRSVYLVATSYDDDNSRTRNHLEGIALTSCEGTGQRFKRVGCFKISIEWDGSPDYEASRESVKQAMRMVEEAGTVVIELV